MRCRHSHRLKQSDRAADIHGQGELSLTRRSQQVTETDAVTRPLRLPVLWRRRTAFWVVVGPLTFLLLVLFAQGDSKVGPAVGIFTSALTLICVVAAARAVCRSRRGPAYLRRVSWAMLVGFIVQGAGVAAMSGASSGQLSSASSVGPGVLVSTLHLLSSILLLVAIFSFPGPRHTARQWLALLLDLCTVVGSGALATWYFIIGPALNSGAGATPMLLAVSLPVQDLLVTCGALLVLLRGVTAGRGILGRLIVGNLLLMVLGVYMAYQMVYVSSSDVMMPVLVQVTLVTGMMLLAVAALEHLAVCRSDRPTVYTADPIPGVGYLPYVAVLGGFVLLIVAVFRYGGYPWTGLVVGTLLMTGGMGIRQVVAIRDNQRLATTDMMTGVANRISVTHALEAALERARRTRIQAAVLLFDLDHFKQVNDTHGHGAGDVLLTKFAEVLRRNVLGTDAVGRLGGDEFAVILNAIRTPADAVVVVERILAELSQPVTVAGHILTIRTSVGIALVDLDHDTPTEVLHRADHAMYQVKRGRIASGSSWRVFVPETAEAPDCQAGVRQDDLS
jgi:diguanylate cyclase